MSSRRTINNGVQSPNPSSLGPLPSDFGDLRSPGSGINNIFSPGPGGLHGPTSSLPFPLQSEAGAQQHLGSSATQSSATQGHGISGQPGRARSTLTTSEQVQIERERRLRMGDAMRKLQERPKVCDEAAEKVREAFELFLENYVDENSQNAREIYGGGANAMDNDEDDYAGRIYIKQLASMRLEDCSTVFVDYQHVVAFDETLATYLMENYLRLEPYLSRAAGHIYAKVQRLLRNGGQNSTDRLSAEDSDEGSLSVAFYGLPGVLRVRELRTDKVGQLTSISGTVTRTSEVRPELISGTFRCGECPTEIHGVVQQFKYTEPSLCLNPQCQNRTQWTLLADQSQFADWQRIRIQEHASEIPAGSMPRTLD
ncbi:MCM DNA helicase complex subunit mcm6, partial [Spiromyces aspiralis]